MLDRLADLEREFVELSVRLADPELLADQRRYTAQSKRYRDLDAIVGRYRQVCGHEADIETAKELLSEADVEERISLRADIADAEAAISELTEELKVLLLPKDPNDDRNVIFEIRGAEGGEEANLFARDLFDMYKA